MILKSKRYLSLEFLLHAIFLTALLVPLVMYLVAPFCEPYVFYPIFGFLALLETAFFVLWILDLMAPEDLAELRDGHLELYRVYRRKWMRVNPAYIQDVRVYRNFRNFDGCGTLVIVTPSKKFIYGPIEDVEGTHRYLILLIEKTREMQRKKESEPGTKWGNRFSKKGF